MREGCVREQGSYGLQYRRILVHDGNVAQAPANFVLEEKLMLAFRFLDRVPEGPSTT